MGKISLPIDAMVLHQMYQYAAYAKHHFGTEIAGWGHYNEKKGIYKLTPLPKQIVSGAEVDSFPNEILLDEKYDIRDMVVQWHSHVDMGVTASATDLTAIRETLKLLPLVISIIVNCKHQYSARIDFIRASQFIKLESAITLEVDLIPYYNNKDVSKEVLSKLSRPKVKITQYDSESDIPKYYERASYSEHPSFSKNGKHYYWRDDKECYGYWDVDLGAYVKEGDEPKKLLPPIDISEDLFNSWTPQDSALAMSKLYQIAHKPENQGEFTLVNLPNCDKLSHILTGDWVIVNDFGVLYNNEFAGIELIDKFMKDHEDKDDKKVNPPV